MNVKHYKSLFSTLSVYYPCKTTCQLTLYKRLSVFLRPATSEDRQQSCFEPYKTAACRVSLTIILLRTTKSCSLTSTLVCLSCFRPWHWVRFWQDFKVFKLIVHRNKIPFGFQRNHDRDQLIIPPRWLRPKKYQKSITFFKNCPSFVQTRIPINKKNMCQVRLKVLKILEWLFKVDNVIYLLIFPKKMAWTFF